MSELGTCKNCHWALIPEDTKRQIDCLQRCDMRQGMINQCNSWQEYKPRNDDT